MNHFIDGFLIKLYGLSKLYVDIWYNQLDTQAVKLVTFQLLKRLQPSIARIKTNLDKTEQGYA